MLRIIDKVITQGLHVILVALCKLTGRDNYFFAICAILAFDVGMIGAEIALFMRTSIYLALLLAPLMVILAWGSLYIMGLLQMDRQKVASNQPAVLPEVFNQNGAREGLSALFSVNTMCTSISISMNSAAGQEGKALCLVFFSGGMMAMAIALYFGLDNQSGGKHIREKLSDWVKEHSVKFTLGGLSPHPKPS